VQVNHRPAGKPGDRIKATDEIVLLAGEKYVSRGGHKLEHALKMFEVDVQGKTVVDFGASTGGFTDCLLQAGARQVYAVDVGQGQLAWKLRQDPRVTVMERTNARNLTARDFPAGFTAADLVVIDCSFISLKLLLPAAAGLLSDSGSIVMLVKPQFEAGREAVDRGRGVIRDAGVHQSVLDDLNRFVADNMELAWEGMCPSPLKGPSGNIEFLVILETAS